MESPIHVLGFCTGEIPAAIAVAARNTSELYQLSIEAVHIIFRFAREDWRRTMLVDETNGSWATTIVGVTPDAVQAILDQFHHSQVSNRDRSAILLLPACFMLNDAPGHSLYATDQPWIGFQGMADPVRAADNHGATVQLVQRAGRSISDQDRRRRRSTYAKSART